ncbi:MAG TPA: aldo/keto reductase [Candidatus Dormibacteraeota bacterium]
MSISRTVRIGDREVTRIGLGTNRLTNTPQNVDFLRAAVDAGVQLIDTAHVYSSGESEAAIGAAGLDGRALVASKGGMGAGNGSPERLAAEIEESLRRLRTDRIDLYYLHRVDPETPLAESVGALKEHQERGQIGQIGLSNVTVEHIEEARRVVDVAAVQNAFNFAERRHELVLEYCEREEIAFVPYIPLRTELAPREALVWLLQRSPVVLPIPGSLNLEHVKANLAALDA